LKIKDENELSMKLYEKYKTLRGEGILVVNEQ
jgi:hypothetical protein